MLINSFHVLLDLGLDFDLDSMCLTNVLLDSFSCSILLRLSFNCSVMPMKQKIGIETRVETKVEIAGVSKKLQKLSLTIRRSLSDGT